MKMNMTQRYLLMMALPLLAIGCQQEVGSPRTGIDAPVTNAIAEAPAPQVNTVAAPQWATLKGRIVFKGDAPARAELKVDKDVATCGQTKLYDEELVVGEDGGVADVFVWVVVKKGKSLKVHSDYEKDAKATISFTNKNCRYEPHAAVVRTGQTLELGNNDPVAHNVNLPFLKNKASNVMIPPNGSVKVKGLKKAERLPTGAKCDVHPWMKGTLLVMDHPYAAVTDANGNFEIKNLPAGKELTFRVWHAAAGYVKEVEIDGKTTKWSRGQFKEAFKSGDKDFGDVIVKPSLFKKK